ncbi:hypothetical protein HNP82_000630 [Catenibacillus scindens]|uniref:Uncharacterized protein n=1 Tax=Catenibacillus scindens TaxID=673271 RepID=A0A7W8H9B4_9FIRM|nr:hypothetical protein [Catenibacillus scindens]MBB5263532.1 hypothetical protein [Catenibacillus scindens]
MDEKMFVVCHMLSSLDGKIDGAFFGTSKAAASIKAYGDLRNFYHCQATLYGTTTMLGGYADGKLEKSLPQDQYMLRDDWINKDGTCQRHFIYICREGPV